MIFKKKKASSKAETLVERYQVLTDNLAAAVVIRDTEGRVMFCSPYTEILTGHSLDDFYNHSGDFFETQIQAEDLPAYRRALKIPLHGEAFQFRYKFRHKNGLEMWAETRVVPIFDNAGAVVSTLSITLDVTGSVLHQKQIEEKNKELEELTYMISHDLKAPIHSINGMATILEEDFSKDLSPEMREIISHLTSASKRLEGFLNSVLEYARITKQEVSLTTVALDDVMADIKNDFDHQIAKAGGKLEIQTGLPKVKGDRLKLYQIFSNLVGNSLKYRDQKRKLIVSISSAEAPTGYCAISVTDNGLGIPKAQLANIFSPFKRAHTGVAEGMGIGLASVKKLADRLGGAVKVESTEGSDTKSGGSKFTVELRLA